MHLDVQDLRAFYYRSALGRAAQNVIRTQLRGMWADTRGRTVVGFGFAAPLLRPYLDEARRVISLMPGPQGVMPWPANEQNRSVLCEDNTWPLSTGFADRLVLLHGLETSDDPSALLDECWRSLGPGGKAVFIVPNRTGLWSRSDATPFGYGRPYSVSQLDRQLRKHDFVPETITSTLFQPPSSKRFWRKSARVMENVGRHIPGFAAGGVIVAEATKQVAAPTRPGLAQRVRGPLDVLEGMAAPETQPSLKAPSRHSGFT